MKTQYIILLAGALTMVSCKREGCTDPTATNYDKKAKKDDGNCQYEQSAGYTIPSSYVFKDASGNLTVDHQGQTDRLNQLREMIEMMEQGSGQLVSSVALKDMFANVNGDGNGNFSFASTKQLKDKCFELDQQFFEDMMDSLAVSSASFASQAASGQAGVLQNGTSTYLFSSNGIQYSEVIEKGLMGAIFMNQALNTYFSADKMNVDNTLAVDPAAGKHYTAMEHHWDEAFGYFGVSTDFPDSVPGDFWGKYCNSVNPILGSNQLMISQFLKGRAAISGKVYTDRDAAISKIRMMWEKIAAQVAMKYLDEAYSNFANPAARLHELSEAYGFIMCLKYAPLETRVMSASEVSNLLDEFGSNFWDLSLSQIQQIKTALDAKY
ncbi:MAG: DUF4856 domain-containing protein [Bacteroidetes bacterium]|nr:MAG: DUF4856 domain-containing protein [Bacteroidota bacterium]